MNTPNHDFTEDLSRREPFKVKAEWRQRYAGGNLRILKLILTKCYYTKLSRTRARVNGQILFRSAGGARLKEYTRPSLTADESA